MSNVKGIQFPLISPTSWPERRPGIESAPGTEPPPPYISYCSIRIIAPPSYTFETAMQNDEFQILYTKSVSTKFTPYHERLDDSIISIALSTGTVKIKFVL